MTDSGPETTYDAAVAHFGRSDSARDRLQWWASLPGKQPVAAFAVSLTSKALYTVTPADVERACAQTRHALSSPEGRRLRREVGESVSQVADWYPNFPLVHSLYYAIEHLGRPPLWDELIAMWRTEDPCSR